MLLKGLDEEFNERASRTKVLDCELVFLDGLTFEATL